MVFTWLVKCLPKTCVIKALGRVEPKRGEVYQNGLGYANEEEVEIAAVSVFASWMPILYVFPTMASHLIHRPEKNRVE